MLESNIAQNQNHGYKAGYICLMRILWNLINPNTRGNLLYQQKVSICTQGLKIISHTTKGTKYSILLFCSCLFIKDESVSKKVCMGVNLKLTEQVSKKTKVLK